MTYQVLARTWRPQLFADVIGQEAVVQTLQNALDAGTLGHAYIFSGLRGVGKTTVARLLAKAVNCDKGPTAATCGECPSCREIADGSSMDVVELDAATHTGVDDVRELQELLRFHPTRDRYRVIIVDEVHMLSRSAFNALLKSLEEPPPYIIWLFATTELHKVPPTILSRCQQLEFRPVPLEKIVDRLTAIAAEEGFELSRDGAMMVGRAAQGSVRDALSLIDQMRAFSADKIDAAAVAEVLGVPRFEVVIDLISSLAVGDSSTGLALLRAELVLGHDAWVLYQEVGRVLRLMLHLAVNPDLAEDLAEEQRAEALRVAGEVGSAALVRMAGLWLEHEHLLSTAANRELALDVACLRLARWPAVRQVEALLAGEPPAGATGADGGESGGPDPSTRDGSRHQASSPGGRLSNALWKEGQRRLVGAVEAAEVGFEQNEVIFALAPGASAMASVLNGNLRPRLLEVCREVFGSGVELRVEIAGVAADAGDEGADPLFSAALEDAGVQLVRRILGGDIVEVRPDGEPN